MKILAIIAILLGGYISLMNWMMLYLSIKKKKFHSSVPFFGAIFLGSGLAYFESTRNYAVLSVIADWGTLVFFVSIPNLIKVMWETSSFNLVRKYVGKTAIAQYELYLYKFGHFTMKTNYNPNQPCGDHGAMIAKSGMGGKWQESNGVIEFKENYGKSFSLVPKGNTFCIEEPDYPIDKKYKHDCLDGIELILQKSK